MKQKEIPQTKADWLRMYLKYMQDYQSRLLDTLRAGEINQQDYDRLIKESQEWYYNFLANLKSQ